MDNPFVIKVTPGVEEIDLSPILRPLIYGLMDKSLMDPDEVEALMEKGRIALAYRHLLGKITRPMLISYLKSTDWVPERKDSDLVFIRHWDLKNSSWDRHGPKIHMYADTSWGLRRANEIIDELARHEDYSGHRACAGRARLEAARKVLAHGNVLEALAHLE